MVSGLDSIEMGWIVGRQLRVSRERREEMVDVEKVERASVLTAWGTCSTTRDW